LTLTITFELDRYNQDEPLCQISRSEVIYLKSYCSADTQTHTGRPTARPGPPIKWSVEMQQHVRLAPTHSLTVHLFVALHIQPLLHDLLLRSYLYNCVWSVSP